MVIDKRRESLIKKVRSVFSEGRLVAIVGWMESNHNQMTRNFKNGGRIVFYGKAPASLGMTIGYVMCTRFLGHADFDRMKVFTNTHPVVLSNGEIKRVLEGCGDLLLPVSLPESLRKTEFVVPMKHSSVAGSTLEVVVLDVQVATVTVEVVVDANIKRFVEMFLERSKLSADGLVGKMVLGDIRRECGLANRSNTMLVSGGWIEPVISDGCKLTGKYKASEKMLALATEPAIVEPDDPISRARRLIAEEPQVREAIVQVEANLVVLRKKVEQIDQAKSILSQLTTMFS